MADLPTLNLIAQEDAESLRHFLLESGYTEAGKKQLWERGLPPGSPQIKGVLLDLAGNPRLATLVRLFELGLAVDAVEVERDLPTNHRETLLESGLLRHEGERYRAPFRIDTVGPKLLVCDHCNDSKTDANVVVGSSGVADRMLHHTPRTPCKKALDVCAGGGIQSLFLADHCEQVVGIDLNPRALDIARFNMRFNGIENVEFRSGNRLDPVEGMAFDLIICNPPFYISPSRRTLYSDNEMELDEFCRCILREAAGHLEEDGYLYALLEWVEIDGGTLWERPAEWFDGLGCDVWLARDYQNGVSNYIRKRLIENMPSGRKGVAEWIQFFEQRRVTKIHGGAVALRRREGKTWSFYDEFDRRVTGGRGEHLTEGFAVRDFLFGLPTNENLLTERFVVSPQARIEEHFKQEDGEWTTEFVRVRLTGAVVVAAKTTTSMARVLKQLDGDRTLEQAIRAARNLEENEPIPYLDAYLGTTVGLLRRGFISLRAQ